MKPTRLPKNLRSAEGRRNALEGLTRSIALIGDYRALRMAVSRQFRALADCDAVLFLDYQPALGGFAISAMDGFHAEEAADLVVAANATLIRWLRTNEDTFSVADVDQSGFLGERERVFFERHRVRLCVPLLSVNSLVAIALITSAAPILLEKDELSFLAACGRQVGLICEAAGRHRQELDRIRANHHAQSLTVAGQLAAAVAHEVRNPLTVIRSTIQFAISTDWPWEQKESLLAGVIGEVDRIENSVGRLLNLSRPAELENVEVDLRGVAQDAVTFVHTYAESCSVAFKLLLDRGPLVVNGDARELRGVFLNLLLNACQAMPTGGEITLRSDLFMQATATGDSRLVTCIEISDTGPGMTPDVLASVFDPFFTTKNAGTGLGLPICLEIIQRHHGDLKLASAPGKGTVATILIPSRIGNQ